MMVQVTEYHSAEAEENCNVDALDHGIGPLGTD